MREDQTRSHSYMKNVLGQIWIPDVKVHCARYLKQPFEDNYVDDSFLDSLVLNAHVTRYELRPHPRHN